MGKEASALFYDESSIGMWLASRADPCIGECHNENPVGLSDPPFADAPGSTGSCSGCGASTCRLLLLLGEKQDLWRKVSRRMRHALVSSWVRTHMAISEVQKEMLPVGQLLVDERVQG